MSGISSLSSIFTMSMTSGVGAASPLSAAIASNASPASLSTGNKANHSGSVDVNKFLKNFSQIFGQQAAQDVQNPDGSINFDKVKSVIEQQLASIQNGGASSNSITSTSTTTSTSTSGSSSLPAAGASAASAPDPFSGHHRHHHHGGIGDLLGNNAPSSAGSSESQSASGGQTDLLQALFGNQGGGSTSSSTNTIASGTLISFTA